MLEIIITLLTIVLIWRFSIIYENFVNEHNLSGSEPDYEPNKWNDQSYMLAHNCYEYSLNDYENKDARKCRNRIQHCQKNECRNGKGKLLKKPRDICNNLNLKSQPGYLKGMPKVPKHMKNCKTYIHRTLQDNSEIYKVHSNNKRCKNGFYKIALVSQPGGDYHYYRQDNTGYWSHKDGESEATNLDSNGNKILDPFKAARKPSQNRHFSDFCGYFCVPANSRSRTEHSNRVLNN